MLRRRRACGMIAAVILGLMVTQVAGAADTPLPGETVACRGEEPFWGLRGDRERAVVTTPDGERVIAGTLEVLVAAARVAGLAQCGGRGTAGGGAAGRELLVDDGR